MKIFDLFGDIFINDKATETINKIDKGFKATAATALKWAAGIGVGAVAVGSALIGASEKVAATTDRIDKLSQRLGFSREGFQEWEFVLSQSGSSMESLQSGMKVMVQKMDELKAGTGAGAEAFEKLGIGIEDLEGLSQEQAFDVIVQKFNAMEDGVEKAALAQDIFSRSGQELLPLLNSTSEAVENMKNQSQELGLVLSDETIDAGVKFTDTMDQVKRSIGTLSSQFSAGIMPIVQQFLEMILENMPLIKEITSNAFEFVGATVTKVSEVIKIVTDVIKKIWDEFGDEIIAVWNFVNDKLGKIIDNGFKNIQSIFKIFKSLFSKDWETAWEEAKAIFQRTFDLIVEIISELWSKVLPLLIIFKDKFIEWVDSVDWAVVGSAIILGILTAIGMLWDGTILILTAFVEKFIEWVQNVKWGEVALFILIKFSESFSLLWDIIKIVLVAFKDSLFSYFAGLKNDFVNFGKNIVMGLLDGINEAKNKVISTIAGIAASIKAKFKAALNINSPSKVFRILGENTIDGLIQGIDGKEKEASMSMDNIASSLIDSVTKSPILKPIVSVNNSKTSEPIANNSKLESSSKSTMINITQIMPKWQSPQEMARAFKKETQALALGM